MKKTFAILALLPLTIACTKQNADVGGQLSDQQMFNLLSNKKWQQVDERLRDTAGIIHINYWSYYPEYIRDNYYTWYDNKQYVIHDHLRKTPGLATAVIDTGSWTLKDGTINQVSQNSVLVYPAFTIDTITFKKLVLRVSRNDTMYWRTFSVLQ